jgi:hypothetical protein
MSLARFMVVVPFFALFFENFFDYMLYAPCFCVFLFHMEPGLPWHALSLAPSWKIEKGYAPYGTASLNVCFPLRFSPPEFNSLPDTLDPKPKFPHKKGI